MKNILRREVACVYFQRKQQFQQKTVPDSKYLTISSLAAEMLHGMGVQLKKKKLT